MQLRDSTGGLLSLKPARALKEVNILPDLRIFSKLQSLSQLR